ncbi:hypothetical protein [Pyrococcus horikoshii]|uniref:Uncharacterized protein n=1 Tax=Pyrococcus horikoshii TaxID=53953 RepID=A0A832T5U9_PYRHR|nr:hypothetical protein [Pyrococcus horikoshii]HII60976.1 hypothetical protein [Pyrococcus horikoshii]
MSIRREISTRDLLKILGEEFEKRIKETPIEKYEEYYVKAREAEWKRLRSFTT